MDAYLDLCLIFWLFLLSRLILFFFHCHTTSISFSSITPSTYLSFPTSPFDPDPDGRSFYSEFLISFFTEFQHVFRSSVVIGTVISWLYVAAIFLVIYLAYRCLSKHGLALPSLVSIKNTNSGGAGTATELTPLVPDTVIKNTTIENFINEVASEKPVPFTAQQLAGYTQNMSAQLDAGGFGVVYKGMLPNGLDVAVKVLREDSGDEVKEQQFMAEVGTLWRTNHINLIRLVGFCFDAGVRALVYELMPKGSIDKYLFDRRHAVGPGELLAIAVGVARGLRYLHEECQKKIIHYDVDAGNVLLDESLTPKLTDFGIAQLLSRADVPAAVQGAPGTPGYMAPEVLGTGPVTEKCDVYSFGLLLFEVVDRRRNMDNEAPEGREWMPLLAWTMYERGELMDLVKESHHMAAADEERWRETAERMCKVAFLCVQEQPDARPTMSTVVNMLEGQLPIPTPVFPFGWMYPSYRSSETIITIS